MLTSEWSDDHDITVICQKDPVPESKGKLDIQPVFDAESPLSILNTVRAVRNIDPDVVVFNQSIGLWGQKKISNMIGMSLPLFTKKLTGTPTFTLLHNVYEEMDIEQIERANKNPILDIGIRLGTSMLLKGSDEVSVTLESYRKALESKYNTESDVTHIPHGMPTNGFSYEPAGKDNFELLVFGHWSPNKRLPLILEAYQHTEEDIKLTVCGTSHPDYPGYMEKIKQDYPTAGVNFQGYVPENRVKQMFVDSDLALLPYKAAVGTSGVLNLAMGHGLPVLATKTETLERIEKEEKAELLFCEDSPDSIAEKIHELRDNPSKLKENAKHNHYVAEERSFEETSSLIVEELKKISKNGS